ncbi:hypothetical protein BRD00_14930 [Halobacteriales archaeon QS_8_69_26]|nr:MAG: hypothetical protein BRD00_14930 [Halobacteriales archaeon QS_8_69_26]
MDDASPLADPFVRILGPRIALDVGLVAVAADAAGLRAVPTLVAAGLTLVSAVGAVAIGTRLAGIRTSYAEVLAQVLLFPVVGYAVVAAPSPVRIAALAVLGVPAAGLTLYAVPLYGDAFVAP